MNGPASCGPASIEPVIPEEPPLLPLELDDAPEVEPDVVDAPLELELPELEALALVPLVLDVVLEAVDVDAVDVPIVPEAIPELDVTGTSPPHAQRTSAHATVR